MSKFISNDGQVFDISDGLAKCFITPNYCREETHDDINIEASGELIAAIIKFEEYHLEHPDQMPENKENKTQTRDIIQWDLEFFGAKPDPLIGWANPNYDTVDINRITDIINLADQLEIPRILNTACKVWCNCIKGLPPDAMKARLGE
jgi:hypothetical protein